MPGKLFIVATPIGNLEDITLRALRVLREADYIAAEDTRHTRRLLSFYEIKTPLLSLHEHNEYEKSELLVSRLVSGENCALVSDAGMPLISDPGATLVRRCRESGIEVTACPGASACLTALVLSGIGAERFCFEGFLPSSGKARREALASLLNEHRTIILYEAPHRLLKLLGEIRYAFGKRRVSVARELTKLHEQVLTDDAGGLYDYFNENPPRGEIAVIIEGASAEALKEAEAGKWRGIPLSEHVKCYAAKGLSENEAIKAAAKDLNLPKREVYNMLKVKRNDEENEI